MGLARVLDLTLAALHAPRLGAVGSSDAVAGQLLGLSGASVSGLKPRLCAFADEAPLMLVVHTRRGLMRAVASTPLGIYPSSANSVKRGQTCTDC